MRKLVIRTDDVGYTRAHNMGTWEVYDHGYATHCEIMLESPATVEALQYVRDMPWVSTGWHTHFWNSPVLPPEQVKSLVIPGSDRFRHDLKTAEDVDFNEALAECRTELERCVKYLGKAPDVGGLSSGNTPFTCAMAQVTKEFGMATDYGHKMHKQEDGSFTYDPVAPKWEDANLYIVDQKNCVAIDIIKETLKELEDYDPVRFLLEDRPKWFELPEDTALMHGFHPAYVDYYVARQGDYGPNMRYYTLSRVYDVEGLCSQRLHDWIKSNNIELCSLTDVLYGTHHYQNHLREIGSDLCVYGY